MSGASTPKPRPRRRAATALDRAADTAAAPRPSQEELLARLDRCAAECAEIERVLGSHHIPELEAIIKLHRVLILKFSLEAEVAPGMLELVDGLMKPVMDWARLEEKRDELKLAEQKHKDDLAAQKQAQAGEVSGAPAEGLKPETLEKIEQELRLF